MNENLEEVLVNYRVARFVLVHATKNWKNVSNEHKIYQMAIKYSKWP
jgi:hypothetical protein